MVTVGRTNIFGPSIDSAEITDGAIVDADVNAAAAIAGSKLQALSVGANAGVIPSTGVANAHVAATAAIGKGKVASDGCLVTDSDGQTVVNDTITALNWDTEEWDDSAYHAAGDNTKLTVPAAGRYLIGYTVPFNAGGTGYREAALRRNGTTFVTGSRVRAANIGAGTGMPISATVVVDAAANDYFEVLVKHTQGADLVVGAATEGTFWIERAGD